jgi:nucleolar protein 53
MARIPKVMLHKPAVEVPHGGASYNPTQEEHQALLRKAADVEIAKFEAEKKLDQQLSYRKELDALPHETQHLEDQDTTIPAPDDETDDDDETSLQKTKVERKTKAQRKKEQRIKEEHTVWERKQQEKRIRQEIDTADLTSQQLQEREKLLDRLAKERIVTKDRKEKEGLSRIGHFHVQDMSMEVQLEDELAESLRQLKVKKVVYTHTHTHTHTGKLIAYSILARR